MARRIHNIDFDRFIMDGRVLCHDRDAALPFEIQVVHDPFRHALVLAKSAALFQHGIHQRGLPMIDVGNDGNVPNIFSFHESSSKWSINIRPIRQYSKMKLNCSRNSNQLHRRVGVGYRYWVSPIEVKSRLRSLLSIPIPIATAIPKRMRHSHAPCVHSFACEHVTAPRAINSLPI